MIDGNGVVISSTEVDRPVAVRYAWADNPACNLDNSAACPPCRSGRIPPNRASKRQAATGGGTAARSASP